MSTKLVPGLEVTKRVIIDEDRTIEFMGEECRVYGTPYLLMDCEKVSRDLMIENLGPGEDSVGTHVSLDHTGATLLGMWVDITAKITAVEGRAVELEIVVRDELEVVATLKHSRFVVDIETLASRLRAKAAKAASLSAD